MTRPRKLALEGMAGVLRTAMKPEGEMLKLMESLPKKEHAAFWAAAWGFIRNMDARADRLSNTPLGPPPKLSKESPPEE